MPQTPDDQDGEKSAGDRTEASRMKRIRLRQLRTNARARAAEAQDFTVRAVERNARYSLWAIIIAAICTMITAAAVGFNIWTVVSNAPS
jgi:hypothetical protein